MKENGGCLHRICGSVGDVFYAVCSSSTGNIAVGGADRTVTIYDPRRLVTIIYIDFNKVNTLLTLISFVPFIHVDNMGFARMSTFIF